MFFYKIKEFLLKYVWIKSQGQFALTLIWQADRLPAPCKQVKAYAEQTREKRGVKKKREKERQDEKQSGQELIQLCNEV